MKNDVYIYAEGGRVRSTKLRKCKDDKERKGTLRRPASLNGWQIIQFTQPRNFACRISHLVSPRLLI